MLKTFTRNRFTRKKASLAVLLGSALVAGNTMALEEVLVSAQKRTESLQDVPIAITAYNADAIEAMGLINAKDIGAASPSLQMPAYPFSNNNLALFIRGIGNADSIVITKDPTVGIYYDGVYAARSTGLLADLSDLERVEVLRGPQGTLYGRNTTSGAVNFINAKPADEFGVKQILSAGNYDSWRSVTHVNTGDLGGFKAKFTATFSDRDGWVENEGPNEVEGQPYNDYNAKETEGYRIALRFDGIDNLVVDYSYDYSDVTSTPGYFQYGGSVGITTPAGTTVTDSFTQRLENTHTPFGGGQHAYYLPESKTEVEGHNLTVNWEINENLSLKSITGYREFDDDASQNFSQSFGGAGTLETNTLTDHEQFSQELQLIGDADRLQYVAGLYYFEEQGTQRERQYLDRASVDEFGVLAFDFVTMAPCSDGRDGAPICTDFFAATFPNFLGEYAVETDVESWAAFGQATYTPAILDDKLDLTVGLRYTDDDRSAQRTYDAWPFNSFGPGATSSQKEKVDYTAIADYSITDDISTYAKVSTGFRSGGSSRNGADFSKPFGNEDLVSVELGWKSEFADQRVRLNGAIFYMEVSDIILDFLPDPINTPQLVESFNSGDAEITGLEIDVQASVTENFMLGFSYAYLDYDMKDVIFPDGSDRTDTTELVWAPENAYAVTADYSMPLNVGALLFHLDYSWQDDQLALANTEFGEVGVDAYGLLNGRISLADVEMFGGNWQFAVFGRNLTDEDSANYLIGSTASTYLEPLTWGGELRLEF
ncbi:MAG: iron complex outermembrane receptor protein [Halioglobus sp.]|jgi:iron complex outermembrane receptor protein